jgi:hypothetical protein
MSEKTKHETAVTDDGLTPFERASLAIQQRTAEALEKNNALLAASNRQADDTLAQHVEADKRTTEAAARLHAARKPFEMRLSTAITLAKIAGEPIVQVAFTATGDTRGPGEEYAGERFVTNVTAIDFGAAEAAIMKDNESHFGDALSTAQREGDQPAIDEIRRVMGGKGGRGLKFRRATEVHMPLIRRCVGKTVERLLADGAIRLVESAPQAAE